MKRHRGIPLTGNATADKIRARLRAERTARGWSYRTAAKHIGLSHGFISDIEAGRKDPSYASLDAIAAAFGLTAREMTR